MMNRIKTLQELNLLDRFLFSEVMADNEILEDVLEIILGHPVPLKEGTGRKGTSSNAAEQERIFRCIR